MPVVELRAGLEHIPYFKTVPWCAALINDPKYTRTSTVSRIPKQTKEDSFFAETLQTQDTIKRCSTINSIPDDSLDPPIQEVLTLFELGSGLNGFPNIAHGGFVATMLDEIMGILLSVNQEYKNDKSGGNEVITHMTAYLNTKYLAPVPTPGIVLATANVVKQEGRKMWIKGTLKDSEGRELTVAECLFVQAKKDPRAKI